jgi:ribosomal protein S18 acetylase RimI-like enzyme
MTNDERRMTDDFRRSSFVVRQFDLERDYDAVIDLWSRSGPGVRLSRISDRREEIAKKLVRDPDLFLVAEAEGRMIGAVLGGYDGRRGMVYHLAVDDAYRRQGIGLALMRELEARLAAKGCVKYYLLVGADNGPARAFYEGFGFEEMPYLIMGKDIV